MIRPAGQAPYRRSRLSQDVRPLAEANTKAPRKASTHSSHTFPVDVEIPNRQPHGMRYPVPSQTESRMAIKAQRNRAKLHILRDNVHRAKRDVKLRVPGATERLKAHLAARLAYAETGGK